MSGTHWAQAQAPTFLPKWDGGEAGSGKIGEAEWVGAQRQGHWRWELVLGGGGSSGYVGTGCPDVSGNRVMAGWGPRVSRVEEEESPLSVMTPLGGLHASASGCGAAGRDHASLETMSWLEVIAHFRYQNPHLAPGAWSVC